MVGEKKKQNGRKEGYTPLGLERSGKRTYRLSEETWSQHGTVMVWGIDV